MRDLTPLVLIAEDDLLSEVELEHALGAEGCRVLVAGDAEAALRTAEAEKPDVAIVDLELAGGGEGIGLALALGNRGVPLIACSVHPASFVREALKAHPAAAVLRKPVKLKAAIGAIRLALAAPASRRAQRG
jgi:CheY-like chemotaxis protein